MGSGRMRSNEKASIPGKLLLRNLYRLLATKQSRDQMMVLDQYTIRDLQWLLSGLHEWNYPIIRPCLVQTQLVMDASCTRWGSALGDKSAVGYWNQRRQYCPSNYREPLAIPVGLKTFKKQITWHAVSYSE